MSARKRLTDAELIDELLARLRGHRRAGVFSGTLNDPELAVEVEIRVSTKIAPAQQEIYRLAVTAQLDSSARHVCHPRCARYGKGKNSGQCSRAVVAARISLSVFGGWPFVDFRCEAHATEDRAATGTLAMLRIPARQLAEVKARVESGEKAQRAAYLATVCPECHEGDNKHRPPDAGGPCLNPKFRWPARAACSRWTPSAVSSAVRS